MTSRILAAIALAGAAALASPALAGGASPAMLANTCAGCHGTDGLSTGPASPTIAGLKADYFLKSMRDYKSGARSSTIMGRIAKGYSDEQLAAMAGYFAGLPFVAKEQKVNEETARFGGLVHLMYCDGCHEQKGRANSDGPILAGQLGPYLRFSFEDFLAGQRDMPTKMKLNLQALHRTYGAEGIDSMVQYYSSHK